MTAKKKQIYLGVMLFAALALIGDRFVLKRAPSPAAAAGTAGLNPPTAGESGELSAGSSKQADALLRGLASETPLIPEVPFPRNVEEIRPEESVRDLFAVPPEARPIGMAPKTTDKSRSGPDLGGGGTICSEFTDRNALRGILVHDGTGRAIINGVVVQVDEVVDGCTIIAIEKRNVRVRCRDGEATLTLPSPGR